MTGTGALLLVAAIGFCSLLAGRLFVGAFGAELFRRLDAAGAAASLAAGTAVLTLLSVSLSGIGFPTRDLVPLIAALQLVPLALAFRRRRLDVLRPRGSPRAWATLVVPIAITLVLGLLPVTRSGGFSFGNDTYTYSAFSEWLQDHGFSEACRWQAQSPATGIPWLYQSQHYDLGIAHWLALVQAAVRPASVLVVYPSTSAWGLVLLVSMVWLAARQLLRIGSQGAGAVAVVFAVVPHALYWGHHNGFLQQGYALPLVLFGLVLLARSSAPGCWRPASAPLLALPFAFLLSVYLPLLPVLGLAAAVASLPLVQRARRRGRARSLALLVACVVAAVALFATRDLLGALSPFHGFATSVAGGHIPWTAVDFLRFALGTRVLAPGWVNVEVLPWSPLNRTLTPLYLGLVLTGLWLAARRPRTRPLAAAAGLIVLGASYFALLVKDPWSGRLGHTWNLFKLAQWGWPFALLLAVAAVRRLAPRKPRWRLAAVGLAVLLPASQLGVHWPWSNSFGAAMREMLPGATLAQLPDLKRRLQGLPAGTLVVVGRPVNAHRWLGTAVSLLAYPRAVVADWTDGASISNHPIGGDALHAQLLERWQDPHVVPILAGFVPFEAKGVELFGGGFARLLRRERPLVVHVVNPSGLGADAVSKRPTFSLGSGRTKLVVFAPAAGPTQLQLSLRPYPGRPGTRLLAYLAGGDYSHRSVRLASQGTPAAVVPLTGETQLRIPLELPRGLCTVVLVIDDGRGSLDSRERVTVEGLTLAAPGP